MRAKSLATGSKPNQSKAPRENGIKGLSQTPGQRKIGRHTRKQSVVTSTPRLLRPRSQEKPNNKLHEPVDASSQEPVGKAKRRRKMKKKMKEDHNNEFSKIRRHLRYLLSRMKYEQNFIEAYGEGWKGQSLEKLRPEKELERAKSDINRFKLKIRDLFKQIDTSCEEGRIPDSLYDSEGEIDSEDIFCAKCGKQEVSLDNDIILCDGECDRAFHQFCLDPPLLKEQVPSGDEGWLCPACDCKVDCFDILNDSMGTDLSIEDSWEKVFPEAAVSGNKLDDNLGLPSDDSEDDDYNPDGPQLEENEVDAEDSGSDESDFTSASDDLGAVANNEQYLGLPSDDSEDDDFDPDRVNPDEDAKMQSSSSDFTSDSDDLRYTKNDVALDEVEGLDMSGEKEELPESNMENDDFAPITAKRNVERLDYKKLHDDTYGNISSDSSDEDFCDSEVPSGSKSTKGAKGVRGGKNQKESESTPKRKTSKKLDVDGTGDNNSSKRKISDVAAQRLSEVFKENHYPDRKSIEKLVEELNLTHSQVSKWFANARWSFKHPEGRIKTVKSPSKPADSLTKPVNEETYGIISLDSSAKDFYDSEVPSGSKSTKRARGVKCGNKQKESESTPKRKTSKKSDVEGTSDKSGNTSSNRRIGEAAAQRLSEAFKENHYLDRYATEKLAKELNLTHSQITRWFGNARWSFKHPEGRTKTVKSPSKPVESITTKEANEEMHGNISLDSRDKVLYNSEAPSRSKSTKGTKGIKGGNKQKESESTPKRKTSKKLDVEGTSDKSGNTSSKRIIGEAAAQRLSEAFKENHYPDRNVMEKLAEELNLTHSQVSNWFRSARWRLKHPEGRTKTAKSPSKPTNNLTEKEANQASSTTPKSRKRKTDADNQKGSSSNKAARSSGRVRAKR